MSLNNACDVTLMINGATSLIVRKLHVIPIIYTFLNLATRTAAT